MEQLQINFTRNNSYHTMKNLGEKQSKVLSAIKSLGKCSAYEVSKYLGWEINRICGRINELEKLGMIKSCSVKIGLYGKPVKVWEGI
jgi:DNA-binding MarR family transcriptional regulator